MLNVKRSKVTGTVLSDSSGKSLYLSSGVTIKNALEAGVLEVIIGLDRVKVEDGLLLNVVVPNNNLNQNDKKIRIDNVEYDVVKNGSPDLTNINMGSLITLEIKSVINKTIEITELGLTEVTGESKYVGVYKDIPEPVSTLPTTPALYNRLESFGERLSIPFSNVVDEEHLITVKVIGEGQSGIHYNELNLTINPLKGVQVKRNGFDKSKVKVFVESSNVGGKTYAISFLTYVDGTVLPENNIIPILSSTLDTINITKVGFPDVSSLPSSEAIYVGEESFTMDKVRGAVLSSTDGSTDDYSLFKIDNMEKLIQYSNFKSSAYEMDEGGKLEVRIYDNGLSAYTFSKGILSTTALRETSLDGNLSLEFRIIQEMGSKSFKDLEDSISLKSTELSDAVTLESNKCRDGISMKVDINRYQEYKDGGNVDPFSAVAKKVATELLILTSNYVQEIDENQLDAIGSPIIGDGNIETTVGKFANLKVKNSTDTGSEVLDLAAIRFSVDTIASPTILNYRNNFLFPLNNKIMTLGVSKGLGLKAPKLFYYTSNSDADLKSPLFSTEIVKVNPDVQGSALNTLKKTNKNGSLFVNNTNAREEGIVASIPKGMVTDTTHGIPTDTIHYRPLGNDIKDIKVFGDLLGVHYANGEVKIYNKNSGSLDNVFTTSSLGVGKIKSFDIFGETVNGEVEIAFACDDSNSNYVILIHGDNKSGRLTNSQPVNTIVTTQITTDINPNPNNLFGVRLIDDDIYLLIGDSTPHLYKSNASGTFTKIIPLGGSKNFNQSAEGELAIDVMDYPINSVDTKTLNVGNFLTLNTTANTQSAIKWNNTLTTFLDRDLSVLSYIDNGKIYVKNISGKFSPLHGLPNVERFFHSDKSLNRHTVVARLVGGEYIAITNLDTDAPVKIIYLSDRRTRGNNTTIKLTYQLINEGIEAYSLLDNNKVTVSRLLFNSQETSYLEINLKQQGA